MDCHEARPLLPLLAFSCETPEELDGVRRHLAECAACRDAMEAEIRSDQLLSRRMLAVPVPADLASRLLQQASASVRAPHTPAPPRTRRGRRLSALAALSLLLLTAFMASWWLAPSSVLLADVLQMIRQHEVSAEWPATPDAARPTGWTQVRGLAGEMPRSYAEGDIPLQAAGFAFQAARGKPPMRGTLWIAEAARISDAEQLPPLETAQIRYGSAPLLVWREGAAVFIVTGNVTLLEALREALLGTRSIA